MLALGSAQLVVEESASLGLADSVAARSVAAHSSFEQVAVEQAAVEQGQPFAVLDSYRRRLDLMLDNLLHHSPLRNHHWPVAR